MNYNLSSSETENLVHHCSFQHNSHACIGTCLHNRIISKPHTLHDEHPITIPFLLPPTDYMFFTIITAASWSAALLAKPSSNMTRPSLLLLLLLLLFSICASADLMLERFEQWMSRHGRAYTDAGEKQRRFEVYRSNVELVEEFNSMSNGYKLADNKFADLTNEEFRVKMLGFRPQSPHVTIQQALNTCSSADRGMGEESRDDILPKSVDWRKEGAVVPVKNQGNCGSCWAFSAVAAMEGISQIKNGKLVSLSEQELIDCDDEAVGCAGGYMTWAFEYVVSNNGIASEASYPYRGADGACQAAKLNESAVSIAGYRNVTPNSEPELMRAAAAQPVSVAVDAGSFMFQLYGSGVYTGPCTADVNHGVTVVGYGESEPTEADDGGGGGGDGTAGKKYWIVKNSWGAEWGDAGYILMQRDAGVASGLCGIALLPSYPIM
ncbi:hypothetical protein GUJ93_ZPchr0002g24730 [Zizania palustris]|uniref:Uncharacterized protein n=1 Tax=Zizania palustris TaxID=103762 RepID=A0A8J5RTG6_ZIZPA|nr:hypothetical protein GUJ93_ZPchr0002g24730 [Zizania palustris]